MKKIILLAAVATLGLASCKKDYSCTCTNTDVTTITGGASTTTTDAAVTTKYLETKKGYAKGNCVSTETTYTGTGYTTVSTNKCELK